MAQADAPAERLLELERLYRTKLSHLRRVAASVSGSRQGAADLVQEAFARAVRDLDGLRDESSLEGWVWRIVVNVARNARRDHRAVAEMPEEQAAARLADEPAWSRPTIAAALARLSERQRLVVFLRYYADLDYAVIGEALGITSGTVGATLTTARASLLETLEPKEAST